ncbi:MAG: DPP IV N-terminal domain-containing protein, partial [Anaerolineales bacterium]|nr:DPP IV N-terminal domain-containing protein [Anaerolineales bacterium]
MTTSLTLEHVATYPLPGMAVPGALTFSPDDRLVAYLHSPDGGLSRQLLAFDPQTAVSRPLISPPNGGNTDDTVSLEEALRRERLRQRETGVTQYAWSRQGHLLVPLNGNLYVQDGPDAALRLLLAGDDAAPILDARFSPDGAHVAFVQDAELYAIPTAGGAPRQLTSGARGTGQTHGLAEYVAQEEMARRSGYWWSPDGRYLAFARVD